MHVRASAEFCSVNPSSNLLGGSFFGGSLANIIARSAGWGARKTQAAPESSHHYGAERGSEGAGLGRAAPGRTTAAFWSAPPPRLWRNDVIDDSGRRALRARPVPAFIARQQPTIRSRCRTSGAFTSVTAAFSFQITRLSAGEGVRADVRRSLRARDVAG